MKFLNLGCGNIFIDSVEWENVDQSPFNGAVKKVNLTKPLPYPDQSFDVIYSSHVIEHIEPRYVPLVLSECARLLRSNGVLRIVVPDFYEMAKAYLSNIEAGKLLKARFVKDEILDQCVRRESGGRLLSWYELARSDEELRSFISLRNGHVVNPPITAPTTTNKPFALGKNRILRAVNRRYFIFLTKLMTSSYRDNLVSYTHLGELHKWVYDFYELEELLEQAGFSNITKVAANESNIQGFPIQPLDITSNGHIRKGLQSMFVEATCL